jgi:hypothetical protein
MCSLDRGLGVLATGLVDLAHEGAVCGAADLAAFARAGGHPVALDVQFRHGPPCLSKFVE